jgi:hypothetical protein
MNTDRRYAFQPQASFSPLTVWFAVVGLFVLAGLAAYVAVVELANIRRPMDALVVDKSRLRILGCQLTIREASVAHRVHVGREACLRLQGGERVTKTAWSRHLKTTSGAIPAFSIAGIVGFALGMLFLLGLSGWLGRSGGCWSGRAPWLDRSSMKPAET